MHGVKGKMWGPTWADFQEKRRHGIHLARRKVAAKDSFTLIRSERAKKEGNTTRSPLRVWVAGEKGNIRKAGKGALCQCQNRQKARGPCQNRARRKKENLGGAEIALNQTNEKERRSHVRSNTNHHFFANGGRSSVTQ